MILLIDIIDCWVRWYRELYIGDQRYVIFVSSQRFIN